MTIPRQETPSIPTPPPERNPETTAKFKREAWWQVTFPVLMAVLFVIVLSALIIPLTGRAGASVTADYAVILLFFLVTAVALVILALLIGAIYLMVRVLQGLPPLAFKGQLALLAVKDTTADLTQQAAESAVIAERSTTRGIAKFIRRRS